MATRFDAIDLTGDDEPETRPVFVAPRKTGRSNAIDTPSDRGSRFPLFEKNGLIYMDAVQSSTTSHAWREELDAQTSKQWFADLSEFVPDAVKAAFDRHDRPPTFDELCELEFFSGQCGVYADMLTPASDDTLLPTYVYPGSAPHQTAGERKGQHNQPKRLLEYPNSRYYKLKHLDKELKSHFISLARIPIPMGMDDVQKGHRRLLCRIGETLFTNWTDAIDRSHPRAKELTGAADNAFQKAYIDSIGSNPGSAFQQGKTRAVFTPIVAHDWLGLATHSPLREQVGKADHGTVAKGRYEKTIAEYAEVFGSKDDIPEELKTLASIRSLMDQDVVKKRRAERKERERDDDGVRERNKARKRQKKESMTPEQREAQLEYHRTYEANKEAAMTDQDKEDRREKDRRRHAVQKALKDGIITQQQADASKANGWYEQPNFPPGWLTTKTKKAGTAQKVGTAGKKVGTAQKKVGMTEDQQKKHDVKSAGHARKYRVKQALEEGRLTQAQFNAAEADDWHAQPDFTPGWYKGEQGGDGGEGEGPERTFGFLLCCPEVEVVRERTEASKGGSK